MNIMIDCRGFTAIIIKVLKATSSLTKRTVFTCITMIGKLFFNF